MYILVYTGIYKDIPLGPGTNSYLNCPTALSLGPFGECCGPSRNSTWPFRQSCRAGFAGAGRGDLQPSAAVQEALTTEYEIGEWKCSSPCTE